MKKIIYPAILLLSIFSCVHEKKSSIDTVQISFATPPDSVRLGCYWYWINDNISKEGVIKDLEAMAEVGITRAQIGNVGFTGGDYGQVPFYSNRWWEITRAAIQRAGELGIEIGMFNSPGWSQSGGPWILPERSMRYLTSVEKTVKGGASIALDLASDKSDFSDVVTLAYPRPKGYGECITAKSADIQSVPRLNGLQKMFDGDANSFCELNAKGDIVLDFRLHQKEEISGIVIRFAQRSAFFDVEVLSPENDTYQSIKKMNVNRTNGAVNVGFIPFAPVAESFSPVLSDQFRVVISGNHSPETAITELELVKGAVNGRYMEKQLAKMCQVPLPQWDHYIYPQQTHCVDPMKTVSPNGVIVLSDKLDKTGVLKWDVPEGEWIVARYGMTTTTVTNTPATPEATGLEVDKMSRKHVQYHFDAYIGEVLRRIPKEERTAFKYVIQDSYETGSQNWTDDFISLFTERYGYDPTPFIPTFSGAVVGDYDKTDRFLWDLRRLVADKIAKDYVGGLREQSNRNGLKTWLENYGHWGFPGEFLLYGSFSDEVGGEYWAEGDLGIYENKAASSCAHIYGKNKVYSESFTAAGNDFGRHPRSLKRRGDWVYTEGVNSNILHLYIAQPYEDKNPGMNQWFSTEFNRKNTWFKMGKAFFEYIRRNMFVLQQGVSVNDVAYFIGEDAPKMVGLTEPVLPKGYGYDFINADVILNRLDVRDGVFVLPDGVSYKIVVLPSFDSARPELMERLKILVEKGGVILGSAPGKSPSLENYPQADETVKRIAAELWGNGSEKDRAVGKGRVFNGISLQEAFATMGVIPDVQLAADTKLLYTHRSMKDAEIYFVSSQSSERVCETPEFRVAKGYVPEFWDAVTGKVRPMKAFETTDRTIRVPLELVSDQSGFVVFRKSNRKAESLTDAALNFPKPRSEQKIESEWTIDFQSKLSGETSPQIVTRDLFDWSTSADERVKYYSGNALYKTVFVLDQLPESDKITLGFDQIGVMASVKVNGVNAGTVWAHPLEVEVTKLLRQGDNALEIEVVNTWSNRLFGDS